MERVPDVAAFTNLGGSYNAYKENSKRVAAIKKNRNVAKIS